VGRGGRFPSGSPRTRRYPRVARPSSILGGYGLTIMTAMLATVVGGDCTERMAEWDGCNRYHRSRIGASQAILSLTMD
jgi:hypothetical protein